MTRWSVSTACAAVALAAGCGSSESDFRERAQAVCTSYAKQIDAVGTPKDMNELAETSGRTADLISKQLAELRALEAPGALAGDFGSWLRLTDEGAANATAIQTAARAQDQQRITELAGDAARNTLSADRLARDLKLPACMIETS